MNHARDLPPLSEAQMEIMQEIWTRGEATVTEVWEAVLLRRSVARNTVLTVMDRLVRKGWLLKRAVANAHLYKASVTQKKTMGQVFRNLMNQSFDGEARQMIVAMLENHELSPQDLDEIEAMIEAKRKSRAAKGQRS